MREQPGHFDVNERLQQLSELGDQLVACADVVDCEILRSDLLKALTHSGGAQGGRPPFDPVMMFQILVWRHVRGRFYKLAIAVASAIVNEVLQRMGKTSASSNGSNTFP